MDQVHHMGCFNDPEFSGDCYKNEECSEHKPNPKAHFCCCSGDMCNAQFRWAPHPEDPTTPRPKAKDVDEDFNGLEINDTIEVAFFAHPAWRDVSECDALIRVPAEVAPCEF